MLYILLSCLFLISLCLFILVFVLDVSPCVLVCMSVHRYVHAFLSVCSFILILSVFACSSVALSVGSCLSVSVYFLFGNVFVYLFQTTAPPPALRPVDLAGRFCNDTVLYTYKTSCRSCVQNRHIHCPAGLYAYNKRLLFQSYH